MIYQYIIYGLYRWHDNPRIGEPFFFRGTIPQVGHSGSLERIAVYRTDGDAGAGWLPGRANQVDSTRKNGGFNGI